MNKLVSTINQVTKSHVVEPNFKTKFIEIGKKLSAHFTQTDIEVCNDKSQRRKQLVVHCKNLGELLNDVLLQRQVYTQHIVKLGLDGGGGFFKVSLGIQEMEQVLESRSPPCKKTLTSQVAKESGVKRQLLVAVAEEVPQNYNNVRKILNLIYPEGAHFLISCDLKLANIICGLQSHSSSHPCTWCEVDSKDLSACGSPRIFGSLRKCFKAFQDNGQDYKRAKDFKNVVHEPLLSSPDNVLVLDFIPPMELHLLLGVVNHLFRALKEEWLKADEWPKALHIKPQPFHGGQFAGNECRKLLKNVDILQRLAEEDCAFNIFGIVDALRKFDAVVSACFGMTLEPDYYEKLSSFQASYLALDRVSVTPKVNAVFYHIKHFIEKNQDSLGKYSEQATEALHHSFKSHWSRYKRPVDHPEYGKWLQTCLVDYNSKNI